MIQVTVALPVWNAQKIAWLCLESLKRQVNVDFEWELIIFEEDHGQKLGVDYFMRNGVENIQTKYITEKQKYTLGQKWHRIVKESDPNSKVFIFCAVDNYYHSYLLRDSLDAINAGCDWFYTIRGHFYDFQRDKLILYDAKRRSGLQMAASMAIAKRIPDSPRNRLVDIWLVNNMKPQRPRMDTSDHWKGTLWTNGYNQISTKRGIYFDNIKYPFKPATLKLEEIVPFDIVERIKSIS